MKQKEATMKNATTIRLPNELKILAQKKAKSKGMTLNSIVIQALWEFVEKK